MTGTSESWRAPVPAREEPGYLTAEREALEGWLDYHRATLVSKCAGLDGEQLTRRSVPPSNLSLLGLVRHMTEVERGWFRRNAAGEDIDFPYSTDTRPEDDFFDLDPSRAAADLAAFEEECTAARNAVSVKDLDTVVASRGHHPERIRNIRWIYLHMIEEYARHNGHADLLREAIDGATGD